MRKAFSLARPVIAATALLAAAAVAVNYRIYAIVGNAGGYLLWDSRQAYIFVKVSDLGYDWSAIEYPWVLFKRNVIGGFAAAEIPSDQTAYLFVARIMPSGIERRIVTLASRLDGGPGSDPDKFTPLEGRVYAFCPSLIGRFVQDGRFVGKDMNDGLCWWNGDHFDKATDEERNRLGGISLLTREDFQNNKSSWSRRAFGAVPMNENFTVRVGEKFRVTVDNVNKGWENAVVSVNILRPGTPPEEVGVFEARYGPSSRAVYQRLFFSK